MKQNKKNIIFVVSELHENGYTKRALDFVNILAKKFNIILMHGNCKVNVNKFLSPVAKESILHRVEHGEAGFVAWSVFNKYPNVKLEKLTDHYTSLDEQILDFYKKSVDKYNISDIYWYSKTERTTPFYIKAHIKTLNVITVLDYLEYDADNVADFDKWWTFINNHSAKIIYRWEALNHKITNPNKVYIPVLFDIEQFKANSNQKLWNIDKNLFKSDNLSIGFLNYYDHNRNGLWDMLSLHDKLIKNNVIYDFVILGRAPIYWWNYELDFLKANKEFINDHTKLIGWRTNVAPYIKNLDVVVSNTTWLDSGYKISQTLLETIALGKGAITTNYNEYEALKQYGVIHIEQIKFVDYVTKNLNELKNLKTDSEKFISENEKNIAISEDVLNKLGGN